MRTCLRRRACFTGRDEENVPLINLGGQARGALIIKSKFTPTSGQLAGEGALERHQAAVAAAMAAGRSIPHTPTVGAGELFNARVRVHT